MTFLQRNPHHLSNYIHRQRTGKIIYQIQRFTIANFLVEFVH